MQTIKTKNMENRHFTTIIVDQSPLDVYNAITHVRGWWLDGLKAILAKK